MGCFVGTAVERATWYYLVGVWVASTQFVHFTNAIGVVPADLRELLPSPAVKSETTPNATYSSFIEVVGCLVS